MAHEHNKVDFIIMPVIWIISRACMHCMEYIASAFAVVAAAVRSESCQLTIITSFR